MLLMGFSLAVHQLCMTTVHRVTAPTANSDRGKSHQ